jgi:hypothetical protein
MVFYLGAIANNFGTIYYSLFTPQKRGGQKCNRSILCNRFDQQISHVYKIFVSFRNLQKGYIGLLMSQ